MGLEKYRISENKQRAIAECERIMKEESIELQIHIEGL